MFLPTHPSFRKRCRRGGYSRLQEVACEKPVPAPHHHHAPQHHSHHSQVRRLQVIFFVAFLFANSFLFCFFLFLHFFLKYFLFAFLPLPALTHPSSSAPPLSGCSHDASH